MGRAWSGTTVRKARAEVFALYGDTCWLCGRPGADTVDHLLPRQHGGTNSLDNMRPAHLACNVGRGNRTRHAVKRGAMTVPLVQPRSRKW